MNFVPAIEIAAAVTSWAGSWPTWPGRRGVGPIDSPRLRRVRREIRRSRAGFDSAETSGPIPVNLHPQ